MLYSVSHNKVKSSEVIHGFRSSRNGPDMSDVRPLAYYTEEILRNWHTKFTNSCIEPFLWTPLISLSPSWHITEEISHIMENNVPLEKSFYCMDHYTWLWFPICSVHWVAQNQIRHQHLPTTQNLPFAFWPLLTSTHYVSKGMDPGLNSATMTNNDSWHY